LEVGVSPEAERAGWRLPRGGRIRLIVNCAQVKNSGVLDGDESALMEPADGREFIGIRAGVESASMPCSEG
jgi:hypothetical protein